MTTTDNVPIRDRRTELKVKIKSLADEARTIRLEERKLKDAGPLERFSEREGQFIRLRLHRIDDVRGEQRASLLAYAYIRGRTYRSVEPKVRRPLTGPEADWLAGQFVKKAEQIATRFLGASKREVSFRDWLSVA